MPADNPCSKCHVEPHDGWTGEGGGQLCQDCWEAECSASWWAAVNAINSALAKVVPDAR